MSTKYSFAQYCHFTHYFTKYWLYLLRLEFNSWVINLELIADKLDVLVKKCVKLLLLETVTKRIIGLYCPCTSHFTKYWSYFFRLETSSWAFIPKLTGDTFVVFLNPCVKIWKLQAATEKSLRLYCPFLSHITVYLLYFFRLK